MGRIADALKKAEEQKVRFEKYKAERHYVATKSVGGGVDPHVIFHYDPKSFIAEQYRLIRTNFLNLSSERQCKDILFTSAAEGEGKSVSLVNLGISIATELNKKVLLVDANLKKPELHQLLGVESKVGLSDYLKNGLGLKDIARSTHVQNISVVTGGGYCANSAELLDSAKMKQLIAEAGAAYDYTLYDSPSAISYTDAGVLGAKLDGVIVSVELEKTDRKVIDRALNILREARVRIIGTILTKAEYPIPDTIYKYL